MRITRIISSSIKNGLRVLKHSPFKGLIKNNEILSDFGVDANPYPGIKGAHESATTSGRGAVIGFFNKFIAALSGERRTYSTLPDGSEIVTEIFQLNNGAILIRAAITGGSELYSMLIDTDGTVVEVTPLKTITGDIIINGDVTVNGGDVVADGISLKTHTHNYLNGATPSVTDGPN